MSTVTIKVTALNAMADLIADKKAKATTPAIKKLLQTSDPTLANFIFTLHSEGLAGKTKQKGSHMNFWTITKKGREFMATHAEALVPYSDFDRIFKGRREGGIGGLPRYANPAPKKSTKRSNKRYSNKALNAIDSISDLIDSNEALVVGLKSIRSQIDRLLENFEKHEEDVLEQKEK